MSCKQQRLLGFAHRRNVAKGGSYALEEHNTGQHTCDHVYMYWGKISFTSNFQ